jgi:ABC-2 type transport system permease protein
MLVISVGLVSIGLLIASVIESLEGFNLIMSFVNMPMFFLSGALFPMSMAPGWLHSASYFDPLTYSVDALRTVLLGGYAMFPIFMDIAIIIGFAIIMILLCTLTFRIRK